MLTPEFKKSSRSGAAGHCVEARRVAGPGDVVVEVRDSKNPTGPVLGFTADEWTAFLGGARDGEFDL